MIDDYFTTQHPLPKDTPENQQRLANAFLKTIWLLEKTAPESHLMVLYAIQEDVVNRTSQGVLAKLNDISGYVTSSTNEAIKLLVRILELIARTGRYATWHLTVIEIIQVMQSDIKRLKINRATLKPVSGN